jgi:tetratricopeptide (TPR) repeat protein
MLDSMPKLSRAEELNAIGAKFFHEQQMEPARLHFLAALSLESDHPQALQNLGAVLRNMQHFEAAESVARRSVKASRNNPFARNNLGVSLLALKKYDEALDLFRTLSNASPDLGPVWHNFGLTLYMRGRHAEALKAFDKAMGLKYESPQVLSDRALSLLSLGQLDKGLAAYECRWMLLAKNKVWDLGIPEWQGQDLDRKHVLVHHEQGLGDSLMLVRFVKEVQEKGAIVTLVVPEALVKLFARSFPSVRVLDYDEDLNATEFDYHSPMLSVVRWLGYKTPVAISSLPYLASRPTNVHLPEAQLRIGICWASGNHGPALRERRRMVPLTAFLRLSEIPNVKLISLQVGYEGGDIVRNGMEGIVYDVGHHLDDFSITADVISALDCVISVDSAVAHLAGALGKPCLMLSPYTRCWRWWKLYTGQPWYDQMKVFVQSPDGTWDAAMRRVTQVVSAGKWKQ